MKQIQSLKPVIIAIAFVSLSLFSPAKAQGMIHIGNTAQQVGTSLMIPLLAASEYVNPYSSEGQRAAAFKMGDTWSWFIVSLLALLALIVAILIMINIRLNQFSERKRMEKAGQTGDEYHEKASWWDIFVKAEKDRPLDAPIEGHDYDGIVELDNNPPAWFNWLFFLPIIWGLIYVMYYHVLDMGHLQDEEYVAEVEAATAALPEIVIDFSTAEALTDAAAIADGEAIFKANCSACHLDNGGGSVGPNLTDKYWINGGDFGSVYQTINDGVQEKGMAAWGNILTSDQVLKVSSYVETLRNTDVEGGKQAEGDEYIPE